MIWWTSIAVVGFILLKRDSLCQKMKITLKDANNNLTAKEDSCVTIVCKASGLTNQSHPARLLWYKNAKYHIKNYNGTVVYSNDPIRPAHQDFEGRVSYKGTMNSGYSGTGISSCDVQICCLRMNDSGSYAFRFEGPSVERSHFFTKPELKLEVQETCKVSFVTTGIHLKEFDVANFNCSTLGSCPTQPKISGLPQHAQYLESGKTSTVVKLTVDWRDNGRELSCNIPGINNKCRHQPSITLQVQYSPRDPVLTATRSQVELGGSLTLTCSAEAVPAPHKYTWFFHTDQKNWTTHSPGWTKETLVNTLRVQPVTRAHHGRYHCSATNPLGQGNNSSGQLVEVLFAPYQLVLSVVTVATEGDVIPVGCRVESWPLPSSLNLSWSSTMDPSMHRLLRHVSNTTSLNATLNVTSASAGWYTCRARNSQGSNYSAQELEVYYAPQNVSVKVEPGSVVTEETRLDLFCGAQSMPPVISYTWTRTSADQAEVVGSNQSLTIASATPADHGGYRCSAKNKLGSTDSPEVRVDVKYAPKHAEITGLSGVEYDARVPVQLSCRSVSFPPVHQYKWYRKQNDDSNEEWFSNQQDLTVDPEQPGIYYCFASNGLAGKHSASVRLFLNRIAWNLKGIFWAIPFVCIPLLAVIAYLVCRYKRNKLVSDRARDPLPYPVNGSPDARGSRDGLLPNHAHSDAADTGHASSHTPQSNTAGPERLSSSIINTVYSTVNLCTGTQPIREDHGYAANEVNYASLHFASQGMSQGSSPPAVVDNVVYAKITKNNENLDEEDTELGEIELNYSQVTFTAKQWSETRKTKKTTT
ncbi:hypothetical protein NHX12_001459 [Muraenolepis orangiensis]|uniref:B-cell receptor CD22 n=1 Tax=Muraenolepis orangiensis TaxID=630683 RepID=A0A9Q0E0R8_9TELE|nr:hypothetical protein NHX12_001459 [Muraenolepis orangiensis]